MHTSVAYVLQPKVRKAEFASGRPCESNFHHFCLE